jgi:nitrile hydratase accessory protein
MASSLAELMRSRGIEPPEVSFQEPWQARAFAMALAIVERSGFEWEEFRQRLIAAIARADASASASGPPVSYYECWLLALEETVKDKAIVSGADIDARAEQIAANPPTPTKAIATGPIKVA